MTDISTARALAHAHLGSCDVGHTKTCDMLTLEFARLFKEIHALRPLAPAVPPAQGKRPSEWTTPEMLERGALIFELQAKEATGSARAAHEECASALRARSAELLTASAPCRRCSDCHGAEHHWIDNADVDLDDATHACKHCDAVGDECETCDGEGGRTSEDGHALGLCPRCKGHGVVERTVTT